MELTVTFIGNATMLISFRELTLLTDPNGWGDRMIQIGRGETVTL
jgi:hypothetical protein